METNKEVYERLEDACCWCSRAGRSGDCYEGPVEVPKGRQKHDRCPSCGYPYGGIDGNPS